MTKAIAKTYNITRDYGAYMTKALIAGCLIMAFLYALNTYSMISRTVAAQKVESQTATLQNSVEQLDAEYITLSNKITPDIEDQYGLEQSDVSAYIQRTRSLGSANAVATEL